MASPWKILITGTPGVGKTTLSSIIAKTFGFTVLNVSEIIKSENLYESYDEELDTTVFDDEKTYQYLDNLITKKYVDSPVIIDFHSVGTFPLFRWFDIIIVLKTDVEILKDRLAQRGYNNKKITDNLTCEFFDAISDDILSYFVETGYICSIVDKEDKITEVMNYSSKKTPPYLLIRDNNTQEDLPNLVKELSSRFNLSN